jgi:FkbM family methyltransferase
LEIIRKIFLNRFTKTPLVGIFTNIFGLTFGNAWSSLIAAKLARLSKSIPIDGASFKLVTSNPLLLWRAKTFFTKEPDTLKWIDSMPKESVFFDVGANVGVYSIYAGMKGLNVFSFEPEASNYFILNSNIKINNLDKTVKAFCLAISDSTTFDTLRLTSVEPGAALNSFSENIDHAGKTFSPISEQGCLSFSVDDLAADSHFGTPDYLKIDVDGLEYKILNGADKTLKNPKLKEVLMEVNEMLDRDMKLVEQINSCGFKVRLKSEPEYDAGKTVKMRNYIFSRV